MSMKENEVSPGKVIAVPVARAMSYSMLARLRHELAVACARSLGVTCSYRGGPAYCRGLARPLSCECNRDWQ